MPVLADERSANVARTMRRAASAMYQCLAYADSLLSEWQVKGIGQIIPDDPNTHIVDGAPDDGRRPISGADVHRVVEALQAAFAALTTVSSNGHPHWINALRIAPDPVRRPVIDS